MMRPSEKVMAASTSHTSNGGPDHNLRERPVKAANPGVLRAQSEERGLKPNGSPYFDLPTGLSRYAYPQVARTIFAKRAAVVVPPPCQKMRPLRRSRSRPFGNKSELSKSTGYFPPSIMLLGYLILTLKANTATSADSSCSFGLDWPLWLSQRC